jgi:hypothetical protein
MTGACYPQSYCGNKGSLCNDQNYCLAVFLANLYVYPPVSGINQQLVVHLTGWTALARQQNLARGSPKHGYYGGPVKVGKDRNLLPVLPGNARKTSPLIGGE